PYVSQENLWKQTQEAFAQDGDFEHNPPHVGLGMAMPVFFCPSDSRAMITVNEPSPLQLPLVTAGLTSYLGVDGTNLLKNDGCLLPDRWIKINQIKDGTSNTIIVGERPPPEPKKFGWWYAGVGQFVPQKPSDIGANFQQQLQKKGRYTGSLAQTMGAA